MTKEAMVYWNRLATPPKEALKPITAGRLAGKTDINPQWRIKAMTEVYGDCGVGWKYEVKRTWTEQGSEGQVAAFAEVAVYTHLGDQWSAPIPGIGGSMFVDKERAGLYTNDEAFKMAITDALSVALKFLGVASDVYEGKMNGQAPAREGSKYTKPATELTPSNDHTPGEIVKVTGVERKEWVKGAKRGIRFIVTLSSGVQASTFNEKLGQFAETAQKAGMDVLATVERAGTFLNLVELKAAPSTGEELPPVTDDDLPF